ncbi:hypothetical protein GH714_031514 [Hevea brasiliensis]|uniref:Trichome birefringence-like C-terminal domain-containing protein n=1 Tax=Hevea brasiliensis TaxID=3981 RepID=A0A6A6M235_HEVBR|nr:hypothetical protein GH714_031514 [Hevea brasiliensis]
MAGAGPATKHLSTNGGTLVSELKRLSSLLKTRRTLAFAYGFMFAFVAFTVFLAFNPSSNSSAPWFSNIFTTSSVTSSSDSYRSQFSSIFSYFLPNNNKSSSQKQVHDFSTLPTQNTTRSNTTLSQPSGANNEVRDLPTLQNHTQNKADSVKPLVLEANQSSNGSIVSEVKSCPYVGYVRGKRLVFVGDSLNRICGNLVCILKGSVKDPSQVFEANGRHHFRGEASYSFIFKDYKCTIEFFVSPFLVQEWEMPDKNGTKKETLRLDLIGRLSDQYKNADIIIFNTGHWWTHEKTSKGKDYYQEGSHVYDELNVLEAFRKALTTWARWVDANINPMKSVVFFRGYSASHFSGGQWNSGGACDNEVEPIKNAKYLTEYPPKMLVLEKVLRGMKTHVTYLNVTQMTDYRKDGHPSIFRKQNLSPEERKSPLLYQDCSHWCLPGVPDTWNEILYSELLINEYQKRQVHKRHRKKRNQHGKDPRNSVALINHERASSKG